MSVDTPTQPTIFIAYRRDDSQAWAGRIADYLNEHSNARVLIDVDSISRGQDYTQAIKDNIDESDVVLIIVGKTWLNAEDKNGEQRLLDGDDPVRLEVHRSLSTNKMIIPILVDGADMPSRRELPEDLEGLAVRNGLTLGHQTFKRDVEQLVSDLSELGASVSHPDALPPAVAAPAVAEAVTAPPVTIPSADASPDKEGQLVDPWRQFWSLALDMALFWLTFCVGYIYWAYRLTEKGQTPAGQIMGLRVVNAHTLTIASPRTMTYRNLLVIVNGALVVFAGVGFFILAGSLAPLFYRAYPQSIWDFCTKTTLAETSAVAAHSTGANAA